MQKPEVQRTQRIGWLRAAVLGADDGIVSTASLVVGVAASGADRGAILVAGMAGLVGGGVSMAGGGDGWGGAASSRGAAWMRGGPGTRRGNSPPSTRSGRTLARSWGSPR